MAFQPRVVKQNRGSAGEGIWIIKLKEANYCGSFGERSCEDSEVLLDKNIIWIVVSRDLIRDLTTSRDNDEA